MHLLRFLAVLLTTMSYAHAEPFMVLGRAVELVPPAGYCALGKTPIEREFLEKAKSVSAPAGQLLQIAVPCQDLRSMNAGAISQFPRTANVMVIKARGQLRIDPRSRADFLRGFGTHPPVNIASVNSRLRAALSGKDMEVVASNMTPLGNDDVAFYWSLIGTGQADGGAPRKLASVSAALLVNGLPLSVQVSEDEGATDGPAPATVTQRYVNAIVARN